MTRANLASREWANPPTLIEAAVTDTDDLSLDLTFLPDYSLLSGLNAAKPSEAELAALVSVLEKHLPLGTSAACAAISALPKGSPERTRALEEAVMGSLASAEVVKCRAGTLSALLAETPLAEGPIDLLKVDVEKAELAVLRSLSEADWARVRQVAVEVHAIGDRVAVIEALLRDHGFNAIEFSTAAPPKFLVHKVLGVPLDVDAGAEGVAAATAAREGDLVNMYARRA